MRVRLLKRIEGVGSRGTVLDIEGGERLVKQGYAAEVAAKEPTNGPPVAEQAIPSDLGPKPVETAAAAGGKALEGVRAPKG